jgi:hypothetical protein
MRLRFLQQGKDLLPLHTRKALEKVCNGVSGLKMVKQTLNWYPGPGEDRLASENFRVPRNDFLHGNLIALGATLCEPKLLPTREPERISISQSSFEPVTDYNLGLSPIGERGRTRVEGSGTSPDSTLHRSRRE